MLWLTLLMLGAQAGKPPRPELPSMRFEASVLEALDVTLPSGLRLILHQAEGPAIVGVSSMWDAGSRYDETPGTATVAAHLMGRRVVDGLAIEEQLERLGCQASIGAGYDFASFDHVCPSAALDLALEAELGRFARAFQGITDDDVRVERRSAVLDERFARDGDWWEHRSVLSDALLGTEHPYTPVATEESLARVTLADIASFTEANYAPSRATLVVVGDIERSEVLRRIFEGLPPSAIHPRMTETRLEEVVLHGMEEPLPWPLNANDEPLTVRKPRSRIGEDGVGAVEPSSQEPIVVQGAVDRPHAIVAWSLPGGWRMNELAMALAADQLEGWTQNEIDRGVYRVQCDVVVGLETSQLICDLEGNRGGKHSQLTGGIFRALTREWVDNVASYAMRDQRVRRLAATLDYHSLRADWSSPANGRAAVMARSAHTSGVFDGWARDFVEQQEIDGGDVRELFDDYIKKKNAVVIYVEPMSDAQLLASRPPIAPAERDRPPRPDMSADAIAAAFEPAWLDAVRVTRLDNGMQLISARSPSPFLDGRLQFRLGDDPADRQRVLSYVHLPTTGYGGEWAGALDKGLDGPVLSFDIGAPGLYLEHNLWMLRDGLENVSGGTSGRIEGDGRVWWRFSAAAHFDPWIERRLSPGDPMAAWFTPLEIDELGLVNSVDMRPYIRTYIHPAEATLIAMRDLDPDLTLDYMRAHFEGWQGEARDGPPPELQAAPDPFVVQALGVLDDRRRATALVKVACDAVADGDRYWERKVLGEVVYDRIRMALEDSGAGGSVVAYASEELNHRPRIVVEAELDPSRVEDGIRTLWASLDALERGGYTDTEVHAAAYEVSAELALLQQTPMERVEVLSQAAMRSDEPLAWVASAPELIASVSAADLSTLADGCATSRVTGVLGPASVFEEQLSSLEVDVEVVPWLDTAFAEAKRLNRTAYAQRKRQFAYKPPR